MRIASKAKENFTYNVAWLRRHYGISKKRMARLMGIGVASLSALESGVIPPRMSAEVVCHLSNNFFIRPDVLFGQRLDTLLKATPDNNKSRSPVR